MYKLRFSEDEFVLGVYGHNVYSLDIDENSAPEDMKILDIKNGQIKFRLIIGLGPFFMELIF